MRRATTFGHESYGRRGANRRGGRRGEMDVKMTPMIDVVFLLLVFFVWTASFQVVEYLLPTTVSAKSGAQPILQDAPPPEADFEDVVIRITRGGGESRAEVGWRVNNEPVADLSQLQNILKGIAQIKADAPVILHPDQDVPLGDVIDVYDVALLAGFQKVQFTAEKD